MVPRPQHLVFLFFRHPLNIYRRAKFFFGSLGLGRRQHQGLLVLVISIGLICFDGTTAAYGGSPSDIAKESEATSEDMAAASTKKAKEAQLSASIQSSDLYGRMTPRSSYAAFVKKVDQGDFEAASRHLDLRHLPVGISAKNGSRLVRQLKIIFDRTVWPDEELMSEDPKGTSDDGLSAHLDLLGIMKTDEQVIKILMQHVPRGEDGLYVWKISNKTVGMIPHLYRYYGYSSIEEYVSSVVPDTYILGWPLWQWLGYFILFFFCWLGSWTFTHLGTYLLLKKKTQLRNSAASFLRGPFRISLWFSLGYYSLSLRGPSEILQNLMEAATLLYFVWTWTAMCFVNVIGAWTFQYLEKRKRHAAQILLDPAKTIFKGLVFTCGILLWLDNLGVNIGTLLASLGIGGLALALAAQDLLKNLLGSIMILMDRPYEIGHRVIVKGHDGIVEAIGVRSTRLRLLTGHQVSIPNEDMARLDIENVGRRAYIRQRWNFRLSLETPSKKIKKAVEIIKRNLASHECMSADRPPKVFFNGFNNDSVNIQATFWYNSSDYWALQALSEKLNFEILEEFEANYIHLAPPSFNVYSRPQGSSNPAVLSKSEPTASPSARLDL